MPTISRRKRVKRVVCRVAKSMWKRLKRKKTWKPYVLSDAYKKSKNRHVYEPLDESDDEEVEAFRSYTEYCIYSFIFARR